MNAVKNGLIIAFMALLEVEVERLTSMSALICAITR